MRMADLSRESDLPVATIKFYLREGLLPPGERTSPNQARYSDEHVRRLRFIRALLEVGTFSVAEVRAVLDAMDSGLIQALAAAQDAMVESEIESHDEWVAERYEELIQRTGWHVHPDSAAARHIKSVLRSARDVADIDLVDEWATYPGHMDAIARADVDRISQSPDAETTVSAAVIGTVLGSAYLSGLRMLAHQHYSGAYWDPSGLPSRD